MLSEADLTVVERLAENCKSLSYKTFWLAAALDSTGGNKMVVCWKTSLRGTLGWATLP